MGSTWVGKAALVYFPVPLVCKIFVYPPSFIPSAQEPCISTFHRFLPQFGHKKDTTEVVSFYGAQAQQQPRTSWYSTDLGAGQWLGGKNSPTGNWTFRNSSQGSS